MGQINTSNIELIRSVSPPPPKQCLITNIDISDQRKNSKFLNKSGLRKLRDEDRVKYEKIEREFLKQEQLGLSFEERTIIIALNIRNRDSNERNNFKRSYEKKINSCGLFDNKELIVLTAKQRELLRHSEDVF